MRRSSWPQLLTLVKRSLSQLLELVKENMTVYEKMGHYNNATTKLPDIPSRDPGHPPSTLTYDQGKLLVQKGPFQRKLSIYPKNKSIVAGKQAQFSSKWYLIHPHLEYSIVKDAAFCFDYSLFRKLIAEEAWSISGVSAWH